MTRILIRSPLLLILLISISFIIADDVSTTSSEPFLPCTSFTSLSTALTPIAADDPTACSRLQHTLKSVRAVCEYDRPEPVYIVLTGPGDRNKRRVAQIINQHYESTSILQLDGIHYQQQYIGIQEHEKKDEKDDEDKKKGKEKHRAVDLMTDALAHAAQDTTFARAHRQKQKQNDANAAHAATQRELRTVIDEHLTRHIPSNIHTSPIPIIIMHNMQYLHSTSLTFLEKHTRPLLFVGIMTDASTSTSTSSNIKTSTLTQLLATFQPKFRQKWIVIPFDVPDVTVNVTALISEFHTRRAPSTSITSSSTSSSPPPLTTLDSSFIGQRQLLPQVKSFLDDELHGWNLQDGPTVFVFVGPPGVGKTYLASLIAHMLSRPLLTLDMGLYKDKNDVDSLVGPRVGIVGNGFLYEHMKENPDSVVLMDEIEKAHSSLINEFLLPVFGSGYLQDKKSGIRLAIPRSIWILTSNCFEDTVASRWSSLLHQSPSELQSSMITLQSEINTEWIQDDTYICPGTKRTNPFASKAFVDRIRGRVMVFTPYHLDEAQRIAELELEKLHVKMSTEREGSTRSSRHHFNLLWTSDIPLFFARRHVYTSTSTKHGGKSIRDLQRDIMEYVNRVIRQDVRPHLDANEPLSDVILTLNEDKTDIHAILHHDETTTSTPTSTSTSTTTPKTTVPSTSKPTSTSTVPNATTSSTKPEKTAPTTATSSTPAAQKDTSSSGSGSTTTPVQDETVEVEIEASPTIAKMSSLDTSSQTYRDLQSKHQAEIRSHVEQYNSLLQEHEHVQAELKNVQMKMEEMTQQHTHMMNMLSLLAAISLASLFFFSFSSLFFFASSLKVIATLATAASIVVALVCWYFPVVAQLIWYLLTFLYQHWRYVIPIVGFTILFGPRFIFPLLASLLRRKRKDQSTQTDASTEAQSSMHSRPPLPPQQKQKQPLQPVQAQQQQQQSPQQQPQPQSQPRRSRRQQQQQAQIPAEQEAETKEQLQPQAQAQASVTTILPPPVPIGRVTRSGRSPSPATRAPAKASRSRSPSPSLSLTPSPSPSTKLQSPQITPISVTSPAPSMSSDSSASPLPAPPNVWMSPASAQVEISPQTELAVSMAHLSIAPSTTSTSATMDFAAMSPPSFILERATSDQMRSMAQDESDSDDLDSEYDVVHT